MTNLNKEIKLKSELPIVMRWSSHMHEKQASHKWFVRGINTDGRFYGDMTTLISPSGHQENFDGQLGQEMVSRLFEMREKIRSHSLNIAPSGELGVLADGPMGKETIVFRASTSNPDPICNAIFLEMARLVEGAVDQQKNTK